MGCQRSQVAGERLLSTLITGAERLSIGLDAAALDVFSRYYDLLAAQAAQFNLTSVLNWEGVQKRHFVESLAVGAVLSKQGFLDGTEAVIDIGSGAGFPGIPSKIAWPGLRLTLLEATSKKAAFLSLVVERLNLTDVHVVNARAEDAAHRPDLRGRFDVVLARAVAPLPALAELALPFARKGGVAAFVKGSRLEDELSAARNVIRVCGGSTPAVFNLGNHALAIDSRLLLVLKTGATPRALPRSPGTPGKSPLG
jgi:16S rRNA (guanine527-N7)-methyltransferase